MKLKQIFLSLIMSMLPSLAFAYPYCPSDITGASGPCGANETLTVEALPGSIVGNTVGSDGGTLRNFALSNPVNSSISIYGVVENDAAVGTVGIGLWNYSTATLSNLLITGRVLGNAEGHGIYNDGTINSMSNSGIVYGGVSAIHNAGSVSDLTNAGQIWSGGNAIENSGAIGKLSNAVNGTINGGNGVYNYGNIDELTNAGSIYSNGTSIGNNSSGTIALINNTGCIGSSLNCDGYGGMFGVANQGTITNINNATSGVIQGSINAIGNSGQISTITNLGILRSESTGIENSNTGTINAINNSGQILGYIANGRGISNFGNIASISNNSSGLISGVSFGILNLGNVDVITNGVGSTIQGGAAIVNGRTIGVINNYGTLLGTGSGAVYTDNSLGVLNNYGSISSASGYGIYIKSRTVSQINNYVGGIISGGDYGILNQASIESITNAGTISVSNPAAYAISNSGTITTLTNAQGAGNSAGALTFRGDLPSKYNIIIASPTQYGQLSADGTSTTATTFGLYAGGIAGVATSTLNKGTYSSVLSGVAASNLTGPTKGNYNGFIWSLTETDVVNGIWALLVTGASTADTQQSLVNTSSALQNTFTLQNSVLANSFTYDCNVFGANDVCVSAGGRNTQVSAANGLNNTSALLIAAYRVMPSIRVGAYADQNLSVSNAGSTVNLGNSTPLIGIFGAWNERLNGTGTEIKVSAAYGQKNTTVTRQSVGTSEAGSGSSQLNSQGAQITAKYGFGVTPDIVVSPYAGIRYTQNNMGGYSETATSSVTAPLTYSAINTNATTALVGFGASYSFIPQATVFAGAGVETDTNTSNGTYSATGIVGLTPINFNANPVKTRPTATLGAYYDVEKNQRVGITGIYRQEPYQAVQTTTVIATYTVGL